MAEQRLGSRQLFSTLFNNYIFKASELDVGFVETRLWPEMFIGFFLLFYFTYLQIEENCKRMDWIERHTVGLN